METLVERHQRACDGFSRVADAFGVEQWSLPTPCTEWDARALVEHVIGFHEFLILRPLGIRANRPRVGPAARWRATQDALFAHLETDGALDRATDLPGGGQSSPRLMLGALTIDVLVHTWDLARAGGSDPQLDRELCEAAHEAARTSPLSRENGMIGVEIAVPVDADIETRLIALYGRDPGVESCSMRPIRGVLFDMGDTLLGRGDGPSILADEARTLGAEVDAATASRIWREIQDRARTAEEIAKGRDLSEHAHRECWTALYSAADVIVAGLGAVLYEREISAAAWHPFPDTRPVVEGLSAAGIPMVVVSDTGWDIRPVLERHGLLRYFAGLVLSYEHGVAKPAPQLFSAACELLGVEPEDALMVGDNTLTDGGAIESGLRVFLLPPAHDTGPRGLDAVLRLVGLTAP